MIVNRSGDVLFVEAEHRDTPYMKSIPGARYNKTTKQWQMQYNLQTYAALGGHLGADRKELDEFSSKQEKRRVNAKRLPDDDVLYPFQRAGVRFLAGGKGVLLADEMGTGKTVQALKAIDLQDAYPALVVCPKSLCHNWAKEVEMWTGARPVVIEGTAANRRKLIEEAREDSELDMTRRPVVVIINYESLIKHTKQATFGNTVLTAEQKEPKELNEIPWKTVVVDEAHRIKGPKNHSTRSVWGVSDRATYRFALTGTPIVNNPDDLWSIMRFVAPGEYPSRSRFRERYCIVRPGWHGGLENLGIDPRNEPEFRTLTDPRIIRRTKVEVLPELPEKILMDRKVPLTPKQQKAYNQMVKLMMAEVKDGTLFATDPLVLIGRLRYIACAIPVVDDEGNVISLEKDSNKLQVIQDIIEETDDQLVVYAQSRKLIELFERELDDTVSIHGNVHPTQRQHAIDTFQAGNAKVFLATTGAGAEGITLTAANRMVMAMEDWSNVKNKQAHDRIHRIGQERGTEIITLISEGTIEEAVSAATNGKEAMLQELVRDEEAFMRAMKGEV